MVATVILEGGVAYAESNGPREHMDERQSCGIPGALICGDGAAPGSEPLTPRALKQDMYLVHLTHSRPLT